MMFLHHPAVQSAVLPLLLAVAASLVMRLWGGRVSGLGPAVGLVLTLAVWPGFDWPVPSRAQWLPWLALVGTGVAALVLAGRAPGSRVWARQQAVFATVVTVLLMGVLAGWGAWAGSLLLAQLAAVLGAVATIAVLKAWRDQDTSWATLWPLLLCALWLGVSLVRLSLDGGAAVDLDDPYYQPRWD